jgi:hypothetical protein
VVYPSFYEGFGLPIVDAIARGLRVVALDTAVNREIGSVTRSSDLLLITDHTELRPTVARILRESRAVTRPDSPFRTWPDVAHQYAESFIDLLGRELDIDLIRRRWELLNTIDAVHPLS